MSDALTILNQLQVASPCHVSWDEMTGDDQVRHCRLCHKNVYNLSAMTAEGAVELIREKEGKLCVSFYRRTDGTTLTADCPIRVRYRVRRWWEQLTALAVSLVAVATWGCGTQMGNLQPPVQGDLASPAKNVEPKRLGGEATIPTKKLEWQHVAGGLCPPKTVASDAVLGKLAPTTKSP